jgi:hypothetical protein
MTPSRPDLEVLKGELGHGEQLVVLRSGQGVDVCQDPLERDIGDPDAGSRVGDSRGQVLDLAGAQPA